MGSDLTQKTIQWLRENFETSDVPRRLFEELSARIDERYTSEIGVGPRESVAIATFNPKSAALAFDKIYRIPGYSASPPPDMGFYGATPEEAYYWARGFGFAVMKRAGIAESEKFSLDVDVDLNIESTESFFDNFIAHQVSKKFGIRPTIYSSLSGEVVSDGLDRGRAGLLAAISEIEIVDEASLDWDQIREFRKDVDARRKYKRLIRWAASVSEARSQEELINEIGQRLDDYEWSIKKHGLIAVTGALSSVLDPKFIAGASAATTAAGVLGGGIWAVLAGTGLALSKATIAATTTIIDGIDDRRKNSVEIAYLHQVKEKFGR